MHGSIVPPPGQGLDQLPSDRAKTTDTECAATDIWAAAVKPLGQNREIGRTRAFTFGLIWERGEEKPGEQVINYTYQARVWKMDRKSLREHIEHMHLFGDLMEVVKRFRSGTVLLRYFRPHPRHATAKPDPQRLLPGFADDEDESEEQFLLARGLAPGSPESWGISPSAPSSGGNPPVDAQSITRVRASDSEEEEEEDISSSSDSDSDDEEGLETGGNPLDVSWQSVSALAEEAGKILFPRAWPEGAWRNVASWAYLALTQFNREWLLDSAKITRRKIVAWRGTERQIDDPIAYCSSVLRDNLGKRNLVKMPKDQLLRWFGSIGYQAEELVERHCPRLPDSGARKPRQRRSRRARFRSQGSRTMRGRVALSRRIGRTNRQTTI